MKKTAFVTGGRKGIGFAIAQALLADGYSVVISGRGESGAGVPAIPHLHYISCDNRDVAAIERTADRLFREYGPLDLLVNNAGVAPKARVDVLQTAQDSFDEVLAANLRGTFFMTQAVAKRMLEHKKDAAYCPRIVNISSVSAYASSTNRAEYCISKAGVSMVTALFADRLADEGIPVFEVRPGIIETDMTRSVRDTYVERIQAGLTPIRRIGLPEDVAKCVLALAGGAFDFATGQVVDADGGFHLRRL